MSSDPRVVAVNQGHKDRWVNLDQLAHQANPVQGENQAYPGRQAKSDNVVKQDHLDQQDHWDQAVPLARVVCQAREAHKDLVVNKDLLASKVSFAVAHLNCSSSKANKFYKSYTTFVHNYAVS